MMESMLHVVRCAFSAISFPSASTTSVSASDLQRDFAAARLHAEAPSSTDASSAHSHLCSIASSITTTLLAVRASAEAGRVELESRRQAILAAVDARFQVLHDELSLAEALKVAALEGELVVVDGALERLQGVSDALYSVTSTSSDCELDLSREALRAELETAVAAAYDTFLGSLESASIIIELDTRAVDSALGDFGTVFAPSNGVHLFSRGLELLLGQVDDSEACAASAFAAFEAAAAAGNTTAIGYIAYLLLFALWAPHDKKRGMSMLKDGARKGDILCRCLRMLGGEPASSQAAMKGLQHLALTLGHSIAADYIGQCYVKGKHGCAKDGIAAVSWYQRAAIAGFIPAQLSLGHCNATGIGVIADHAQAIAWYTRAANRKHPVAMYNIGATYLSRKDGSETDDQLGASWLRRAAEEGFSPAQYWYGCACESGEYIPEVPIDHAAALVWLRRAADQGDTNAMAALEEL